jgi:glucan phosphorylase
MNGTMILGSKDSTNLNLAEHIGQENITLFGEDVYEVRRITQRLTND